MILNMNSAVKEGEIACLVGLQLNRNPYIGKKGVIAHLQRAAWERGFLTAEREAKGS